MISCRTLFALGLQMRDNHMPKPPGQHARLGIILPAPAESITEAPTQYGKLRIFSSSHMALNGRRWMATSSEFQRSFSCKIRIRRVRIPLWCSSFETVLGSQSRAAPEKTPATSEKFPGRWRQNVAAREGASYRNAKSGLKEWHCDRYNADDAMMSCV